MTDDEKRKLDRRRFLKLTAVGAATLAASGQVISGCTGSSRNTGPDSGTEEPDGNTRGDGDGMLDAGGPADGDAQHDDDPVVADIPELRVVYSADAAMLTGTPTSWDYYNQNRYVDTAQVAASLDQMAMALARRDTAAEAWHAIFSKPAAKSWNQVKVGIKVNTVYYMCIPRYAVLLKICKVLIDELGVSGSNICIFDSDLTAHAGHAAGVSGTYAANTNTHPFPVGVRISANLFSGQESTVAVPGGVISPVRCLKDLVDGTVDILVNVGVNKGHYQAGNVTLCQKNNIGAVKLFCPGKTAPIGQGIYTEGSAEDLVAINQCEAFMGGRPRRQQLCIMDSLWAMRQGPANGGITHEPCILAMGLHPGAVDYLVEKKIRDEIMGCPSARQEDINTFITGYGYSDTERVNLTELAPEDNDGKGWVNAWA